MAGSEGAARRRLEAIVSRVAAVVVAAGVASYALARAPAPPPSASSVAVTGSSRLEPLEVANGERPVVALAPHRAEDFDPGLIDLADLPPSPDATKTPPWDEAVDLPPEFEVEVVRSEDDEPVPFAEVVVARKLDEGWQRDDALPRLLRRTDESGRLRIRGEGHFDVAAGRSDRAWACECSWSHRRAGIMSRFRFRLAPSFTLAIRVVDETGHPVTGASVTAFGIDRLRDHIVHTASCTPQSSTPAYIGGTGADGRVAPVQCAFARGVAFDVRHGDDSWLLPPRRFDDDAIGKEQSIELRVGPVAHVVGSVLHADGTPSWMKLSFERRFDAWGDLEQQFCACDDGHYAASLGPPGLYRVVLWSPSDEFGWLERERRDVDLPGGETRLDFIDPEPAPPERVWPEESDVELASVNGHVQLHATDDAAESLGRGRAFLVRDGMVFEKTDISGDGSWRVENVEPGNCSLVVLVPGFFRHVSAPFVLPSGSDVTFPAVELASAPPIRGRIVTPDGHPLEDVYVESQALACSPASPFERNPRIGSARTDSNGAFELEDVGGPGRLYVEAAGIKAFVVPLPAVGARDSFEIVAPAPRSVRGRIVVAGGLPGVAFEVVVRDERSIERLLELDEADCRFLRIGETPVASDGTFEFSSLPPSEFDFELHVAELHWPLARRHIPAGSVDLDLGDWVLSSDSR